MSERVSNYDKAAELWKTLGDTPVDDYGKLDEPWSCEVDGTAYCWPIGEDREEIWHWFEDTFNVSVYFLMFPSEREEAERAR